MTDGTIAIISFTPFMFVAVLLILLFAIMVAHKDIVEEIRKSRAAPDKDAGN